MHSETSRCAHTHLSPLLSALLVQGCPIALRAHDALWSALGCNPVMWDRAEDPALAHRKHHVDIDPSPLRPPSLLAYSFTTPSH